MARRVEEIKRVRRNITQEPMAMNDETKVRERNDKEDLYEEEYYDIGSVPEETGLNTASGVLAIVLLALAVYLIWAALR
jgi:hypothetical protein